MRKQQPPTPTAAARTLTEPQPKHNGDNRTLKSNLTATGTPLQAPIKPPRTLNEARETRRRTRIAIAASPRTPIRPPPTLKKRNEWQKTIQTKTGSQPRIRTN